MNAVRSQKNAIISELTDLITSEPKWIWKDSLGIVDGPRPLVWDGSQEELKTKIMSFLEGK